MDNIIDVIYNFVSGLFGPTSNEWWTANLDTIRGWATLFFVALVVALALWITIAVIRWIGSLFNWGR